MTTAPATPAYWSFCAAEARLRADDIDDPRAKHVADIVIRGYEQLAEHTRELDELEMPIDRQQVEYP